MPVSLTMHLEVRMDIKPSKVMINGKVVKIADVKGKIAGNKTSCNFDSKWLNLDFTWDGKPVNIIIYDRKDAMPRVSGKQKK